MLTKDAELEVQSKLTVLKDWLIKLQRENVVKINHSVMELVCAKYLIQKGYDVQLEYPLNELLTCDLYAIKGLGNEIVEIETGFIPPENALAPLTYTSARLASKIIRYSSFAGKFTLVFRRITLCLFHGRSLSRRGTVKTGKLIRSNASLTPTIKSRL